MAKNDFSDRKYIIGLIFIVIAIIYIVRLYQLQVLDEKLKLSADNNVLKYETLYPSRGLIYDRNNKLIVYNKPAYDLMIVPRKVKKIDTTDLCKVLDITHEQYIERYKKARKYSPYKASIFVPQLSPEDYAVLQEKMYKFPGFFVQKRIARDYNFSCGAHVLGYISEVGPRQLKRDNYYRAGDYIGSTGIEAKYEKLLRGEKGLKVSLVDRYGRIQGKFNDGEYDKFPVSGKDINVALDIDLQELGEKLLQNKVGSVVAIEPSTGEVLALISSPTYDPAALVGRARSKNYPLIKNGLNKPMLNRALKGMYPPGSTFKMVNAAIGLQEGVITPHTEFSCAGKLTTPIKCTHFHGSYSNVSEAIETSCNPFFWQTFKAIIEQPNKYKKIQDSYQKWYDYVISFGYGISPKIDLPGAEYGLIPRSSRYDKIYGKKHWRALTIRSLAIGQGEITVTPLQMALEACVFANRGYYIDPHIIKNVHHDTDDILSRFKKNDTGIEKDHFDLIVQAMRHVYEGEHGTARFYQNDSLPMCGKTGTVQNPHGEDHSMFIAFAPVDTPKIAISVVVENGGYGSTIAAPVATLMMEKYVLGDIPQRHKHVEQRMYDLNLISDEQDEE